MDFLREWITSIIIAVIINSIIELIIPEGKNKKYIRGVMGIYITFAIISPIFSKLTNTTINLQNIINKYNTSSYVSIATSVDANSYIEDTYILKIKEDITERLNFKGYEVKNITMTIERENENSYGEILSLKLEIENIENSTITKIEKVNVKSKQFETETKNKISDEKKTELKDYLNSIYGINCENIEIY